MALDFSSLFVMGGSVAPGAFIAKLDEDIEYLSSIHKGEVSGPRYLTAKWHMGRSKPADVVLSSEHISVLVSQRVLDGLAKAKLIGYGAIPCRLEDKVGLIHDYFFLAILGRCGPIDHSRARMVDVDFPAGKFPMMQGVFFDEDTWDGSDLFHPENARSGIFATAKVKRVMESMRATGVTFTALADVTRSPTAH